MIKNQFLQTQLFQAGDDISTSFPLQAVNRAASCKKRSVVNSKLLVIYPSIVKRFELGTLSGNSIWYTSKKASLILSNSRSKRKNRGRKTKSDFSLSESSSRKWTGRTQICTKPIEKANKCASQSKKFYRGLHRLRMCMLTRCTQMLSCSTSCALSRGKTASWTPKKSRRRIAQKSFSNTSIEVSTRCKLCASCWR